MENRGGYPQNLTANGEEVVLTRAESVFLDTALDVVSGDPLSLVTESDLLLARENAGLSAPRARFCVEYLRYKGDLVALSEATEFSPSNVTQYLTSPTVFRILEEASRRHPDILSPIPTKEELAVVWSVVSRSDTMPLSYQKEARQEIAKLMGYYTTPSSGNVNVGVQVVLQGDLASD